LTQCRIRLLNDRKGTAHVDENPRDRRMLVVHTPAHDDVADFPDSRPRDIAHRTAKNVGERYHPVSEASVESEMLT
jgi:hypothetical protein